MSRTVTDRDRDRIVTKIRKLQAKADSTTFPSERSSYLDKITELRATYGVSEEAYDPWSGVSVRYGSRRSRGERYERSSSWNDEPYDPYDDEESEELRRWRQVREPVFVVSVDGTVSGTAADDVVMNDVMSRAMWYDLEKNGSERSVGSPRDSSW
jgi:hypothetical protein